MRKRILILSNHFITLYNFRKELIKELIIDGYEVFISIPKSKENNFFINMGCKILETPVDRRGVNPIKDIRLMLMYIKIMKKVNPDVVLTYTIKPNIYGGIAARICKNKVIHTVTGLGTVYIRNMWLKIIVVLLNRIAFRQAEKVFFLNEDNHLFYKKLKIISRKQDITIVPGSGVNLKEFQYKELPTTKKIVFTFVGRVLKDKGINEFLLAAKELKNNHLNLEFRVVGFIEESTYSQLLKDYEKQGVIKYLGRRNDIPQIMADSSCIVLPSYGEGRGTVLQEGAAVGRPLITCNTYGCKDNVKDGYNGYLCKVADVKSLVNSMEKFIKLSNEEKVLMGKRSRERAEKEFDRSIVIKSYIDEIKKCN